jgi:hypothetical protein
MASPRYDALPGAKRWIHSTLEGKISPVATLLEHAGRGAASRVVEASKLPG